MYKLMKPVGLHPRLFNLVISSLTVAVFITACQKQPDTREPHGPNGKLAAQALQVSPQSVSNGPANPAIADSTVANPVAAGSFQVNIIPAPVKLPACRTQDCSVIAISQVQSNDAWVNRFFAQEIVKLSYPMGEGKPVSLQNSVDRLLKNAAEDARARGNPVPYELTIEPKYLGERAGISRFRIDSSFYTGGAHGGAFKNYYNLNRTTQKLLKLDDIVVAGQKQKLYQLVYGQFAAWVKQNDPNVTMRHYEQDWKFNLTDNFNFAKDGLEFQYQQYEIGAYAMGMPHFTVPYPQLKGIVKSDYL